MNEDLISNNFVDNVDGVVVKRNISIMKLAVAFSILYAVLVLFEYYNIYHNLDFTLIKGPLMIFEYVISPALNAVILLLSIYAYTLIVNAYKSINRSLNKSDPQQMTIGFRIFYKVNIITIILFVITIALSIVRIVL